MKDYILEVKDLSFIYQDGTQALNKLNLKIERGEKLALMGANGSGKSTLFFNLNGISRPSSGEIWVDGKPIEYDREGLLDVRKKIGIVFQDPDNQLFSANVKQEISFGPLNLGFSQEETGEKVEAVMRELNIEGLAAKPTHFLSGGEKKRVAIADVLVMEPEVMIFDEPASGLDPKHIRLIDELVEQLNSKGMTILIATHDASRTLSWADRVVLLHEGEKLAEGRPEEIFRQEDLLAKTNLEKPPILEMYDNLVNFGIIEPADQVPRDMKALEDCIRKSKYKRSK